MTYPVIPKEEYAARHGRIFELMQKKSLDLVVAYADDHAVWGPAHARWLANFHVHFEPVCILFTKKGDTMLLVGPESPEYAHVHSVIRDIRVLEEFTHPHEDYPFTKIHSLKKIIADVFGNEEINRIGIAGKSIMSYDLYNSFINSIKADWIDIENDILSLRAVKTPAEIEVIRYAYSLAETGLQAAINAIKPGCMECEVAAEAEAVMRRKGSEGLGIDTFVASGDNSRQILGRATKKVIQNGEIVLLTIVPRYEGYHGAVGVPVMVGNVGEAPRLAIKAAIKAQKACANKLIAGTMGREAEAVARKIMADAGYENNFLYSGMHSTGVIEFEAPIFGPTSESVIENGQILSIDIPLFNAPWGGIRLEDGYIIENGSAAHLTNIPYWVEK